VFIKATKSVQKVEKCCNLQGFGTVTGKKLRGPKVAEASGAGATRASGRGGEAM